MYNRFMDVHDLVTNLTPPSHTTELYFFWVNRPESLFLLIQSQVTGPWRMWYVKSVLKSKSVRIYAWCNSAAFSTYIREDLGPTAVGYEHVQCQSWKLVQFCTNTVRTVWVKNLSVHWSKLLRKKVSSLCDVLFHGNSVKQSWKKWFSGHHKVL